MDSLKPNRWISSDRRDSSFFMCNSEDIDYDESEEFPFDRNNIYVFNSNDSVLVSNKGKTRREDFSLVNWGITNDKEIKLKPTQEIIDHEIKEDYSLTYEVDRDLCKCSLKQHIKFSSNNHGESCYKKYESSQMKNQSATGLGCYTPINSLY